MTLLGRSPFYKGQKIAPLYMQSHVPRAITIIEFGVERDNCAVTKYKTTKMVDKRSILAINSIFLALASLAAMFQCCVFLLSYLKIENAEFRGNLIVIRSHEVEPSRRVTLPRVYVAKSWPSQEGTLPSR